MIHASKRLVILSSISDFCGKIPLAFPVHGESYPKRYFTSSQLHSKLFRKKVSSPCSKNFPRIPLHNRVKKHFKIQARESSPFKLLHTLLISSEKGSTTTAPRIKINKSSLLSSSPPPSLGGRKRGREEKNGTLFAPRGSRCIALWKCELCGNYVDVMRCLASLSLFLSYFIRLFFSFFFSFSTGLSWIDKTQLSFSRAPNDWCGLWESISF